MNTNNSNEFYVIGLMSGTSLDGLDLCYVHFKENLVWSYEIIHTTTQAYPSDLTENLKTAHLQSKSYVKSLNRVYSRYLNTQIQDFVKRHEIKKLDLIASHGHTIWHQPEQGFTKQIGDHPKLCENLQVPIVVDFRTQDVQLGGQGAPLVPVGDHFLFAEFDACVNFGGFANVSMLQKNERIAFDICPFNKVLNFYAQKIGKNYDNEGKIASEHQVNSLLLNQLNSIDFYFKKGPKSLGVEFLDEYIFPLIEKYSISTEQKIATFSQHVIEQVALSIKNYEKVLVTGGGAFNTFILSEIQKHTTANLTLPNRELVEFKEAMIFAFLGVMKYLSRNNVLRSVTGASKNHSSGVIINTN